MTARAIVLTFVILTLGTLNAAAVRAQEADPLLEQASRSRVKGDEAAPVFVYEFADFQCPHCARFATDVFPKIDSAFIQTGKVRWVFVNLPLPNHAHAWVAHEAAVCAGTVADQFWPMHDRLFAAQNEWVNDPDPGAIIARIAEEIGVPADRFTECTSADHVAPVILQDVIFAASSRVSGTPAFNINDQQSVTGLKTFEEWTELLDKAVSEATGK